MTVILNLTWAIALLPLLGVGAAFLAESPRRAAHIGLAFTGLAFAVAMVVLVFRVTHGGLYENTETFWDLQSTSPSVSTGQAIAPEFAVFWGIRVDPLSVVLMAVTLFLSVTAQVHALTSLRGDPGFRRFFWIVGVLTFGVLALICSPNLFQLWLGWEVAGVAAWMLAVHHWQRPGVSTGAARTLVALRVADLALLLGLAMTFAKFGTAIVDQPATNGQVVNDPFAFSGLTSQWHLGHLGAVAGVGARTLVVLAVLVLVAAVIRATIGPLHVWLSGAVDAPAAGLALVAITALIPVGVLLARVYPLLVEAPHVLTVLALVGAAGSVTAAALALAQRDLFRIGVFAVSSQASLMLATFGIGGFSQALFVLLTGSCLAVAYFLAAGNLARGFRSRDLHDCGGARPRMPRTTLVLGGWALGISGLTLNTYSVLSASFRDVLPSGGHVGRLTQILVVAAVLVTIVLTALFAFRVYFVATSGQAPRRRGFDVGRLREVDPRLRTTALAALAGAALATLGGLPGLGSFTFSRFVFYGLVHPQLPVDVAALLLAAVLGGGGAAAAAWLFAAPRGRVPSAGRFAALAALLAGPTLGERAAAALPQGFVAAGATIDRFEAGVLDPIPAAMGESVGAVGEQLVRLRTSRVGGGPVAALAVLAILLAVSVLAATGHFPVSIR